MHWVLAILGLGINIWTNPAGTGGAGPPPGGDVILWDDNSDIQWDDASQILWDT
jgi:hypothetical protein